MRHFPKVKCRLNDWEFISSDAIRLIVTFDLNSGRFLERLFHGDIE
ncbi:hypothetical protein MARINOS108_20489 [Marinoscillum sp. 108]|nr:hypothetical protein MARINOS108_20489 [Marinoscillum sp. 108]